MMYVVFWCLLGSILSSPELEMFVKVAFADEKYVDLFVFMALASKLKVRKQTAM